MQPHWSSGPGLLPSQRGQIRTQVCIPTGTASLAWGLQLEILRAASALVLGYSALVPVGTTSTISPLLLVLLSRLSPRRHLAGAGGAGA
eukprot:530510-Rhodomonas_salina.2